MEKPVTLFVQCLVDALYPDTGQAVLDLFDRLDIPVDIPLNQTCCGQPAFNAGYQKEARNAARHFIRVFENAGIIVCPSGSCVDMVRHQYPGLFEPGSEWHQRASAVGRKTFELTQFLVDEMGITDVGARFNGSVTYHDSCHLLRNLGVARQPRELIANVKGTRFIEMERSDKCCGFGGTFAVKYPEISSAILAEKVDSILASRADAVVGCDTSCLMQIRGMLNRKAPHIKVFHIAQLLAGPFQEAV